MSMTVTESAPGGIMGRLKNETAELHVAAERSPLQAALVRGVLPREGYAAWLGQMLFVHRALESALASAAKESPVVGRVYQDWQNTAPHVEADLKFFGFDTAGAKPGAGGREMIARIERVRKTNPVALLGMHYVLEGSKNGGKFIAKVVGRVYGLTQDGLRTLDPYGDAQRDRWAWFKSAMGAETFSPSEQDAMVEEAKAMFNAVPAIGADVMAGR
ncbi:MAG TPA: biliverdin-producing heme oxygenase [Phycisphaerales bacterium]|nr:biliverdin-producing heme oxygenase [Phycisphaerales bacterium]